MTQSCPTNICLHGSRFQSQEKEKKIEKNQEFIFRRQYKAFSFNRRGVKWHLKMNKTKEGAAAKAMEEEEKEEHRKDRYNRPN